MTDIVDKPHGPVGEREMQRMYGPAHAAVTLTKDDTIRLQQAEIERLRLLLTEGDELTAAYLAGYHKRDTEIERLRVAYRLTWINELRGALLELRTRLHAAGRRPDLYKRIHKELNNVY